MRTKLFQFRLKFLLDKKMGFCFIDIGKNRELFDDVKMGRRKVLRNFLSTRDGVRLLDCVTNAVENRFQWMQNRICMCSFQRFPIFGQIEIRTVIVMRAFSLRLLKNFVSITIFLQFCVIVFILFYRISFFIFFFQDFPTKGWLIRFSDVIGASHTVDYRFWKYNGLASTGLQQLAELGSTRKLESELKNQVN